MSVRENEEARLVKKEERGEIGSLQIKEHSIFQIVLEKTLEGPLDCKEIQNFYSKGDQPWDFFGRNDAKAETPVLWPSHVKG